MSSAINGNVGMRSIWAPNEAVARPFVSNNNNDNNNNNNNNNNNSKKKLTLTHDQYYVNNWWEIHLLVVHC